MVPPGMNAGIALAVLFICLVTTLFSILMKSELISRSSSMYQMHIIIIMYIYHALINALNAHIKCTFIMHSSTP